MNPLLIIIGLTGLVAGAWWVKLNYPIWEAERERQQKERRVRQELKAGMFDITDVRHWSDDKLQSARHCAATGHLSKLAAELVGMCDLGGNDPNVRAFHRYELAINEEWMRRFPPARPQRRKVLVARGPQPMGLQNWRDN